MSVRTRVKHAVKVAARRIWHSLPGSIRRSQKVNVDKLAGRRSVASLEELDEILVELEDAAKVSDDELRRVFTTFAMEFPGDPPADPRSQAYRDRQFELYEYLHGKPYDPSHEVSDFDPEKAARQPFPYYTESPTTVGNQLIAVGHIIRSLDLRPSSSVLEFGPGWGNTTIALARMGYALTAVDIEKRFV